MTIPSFRTLADAEAAGVGDNLLARAGGITTPPAGAASPYVAVLPSLLEQAQASQSSLVAAIAAFASASAAHDQKVTAALVEEKALDASCSALNVRLLAEVKAGTLGAQEAYDLLFPGGLVPITKPTGRPQLAIYQALLQRVASAASTSNPAYAAIADRATAFRAQVEAFAGTIQAKDDLDGALTAARTARDAAQAGWTAAFRALIDTAAHIHGEDSDAFRAWIRPLLDWRAAQAAGQTRRANAQGEAPTPTEIPAPTEPPPAPALTTGSGDQSAA